MCTCAVYLWFCSYSASAQKFSHSSFVLNLAGCRQNTNTTLFIQALLSPTPNICAFKRHNSFPLKSFPGGEMLSGNATLSMNNFPRKINLQIQRWQSCLEIGLTGCKCCFRSRNARFRGTNKLKFSQKL